MLRPAWRNVWTHLAYHSPRSFAGKTCRQGIWSLYGLQVRALRSGIQSLLHTQKLLVNSIKYDHTLYQTLQFMLILTYSSLQFHALTLASTDTSPTDPLTHVWNYKSQFHWLHTTRIWYIPERWCNRISDVTTQDTIWYQHSSPQQWLKQRYLLNASYQQTVFENHCHAVHNICGLPQTFYKRFLTEKSQAHYWVYSRQTVHSSAPWHALNPQHLWYSSW